MFTVKLAPIVLALLLLATACTPPAQLAAQGAIQPVTNDNQIFSNPLAFTSTLEVTEFLVENEKLVAAGLFTVTDFDGNSEIVPVTLPVNSMNANAACSELTVTLGPLDLQVLGMSVNAQTIQLLTFSNPDKGFSDILLCGIVDAFNNADMNLVATMLNEVLSMFGWK